MVRELWIFGYGSLLWRPDFAYLEREPACLEHWARRLWQGSTDHRGSPGAPGRVVTLVPEPGSRCWGLAFRVAPDRAVSVLGALDHRERGGFERRALEVRLRRGERVPALVYVAGPENPNYLGPAPEERVVAQVHAARGPSGANAEYVLRLAEALGELGVDDDAVLGVARRLRQLSARSS